MIDFEAKNWNGYVTRLMYNCDSDPEIWDFCYIDDKNWRRMEKEKERNIWFFAEENIVVICMFYMKGDEQM